jgi:hypothetical protein
VKDKRLMAARGSGRSGRGGETWQRARGRWRRGGLEEVEVGERRGGGASPPVVTIDVEDAIDVL